MSAATHPPRVERIPHAAANGCRGYTDRLGTWTPCESPSFARMHFTDLCRECHAKQERADELRAGAASLAPAETPQRGDKEGTAFACVGYEDAEGQRRACVTPDQRHLAKGMCRKCYAKNAAAKAARREAGAEAPPPLVVATPAPAPAPPRGEWLPPEDNGPDAFGGEDAPHAPAAATLAPDWRDQPAEALAAAILPQPPAPTPAPPPAPPAEGYAWAVFDQPPHVGGATEPRITVVADGSCRINAAAYALWGREVAAVEILHDRTRRAVALRPCDPAKRHARQLRADKGARQCSLRAFRRSLPLADFPTGVVIAAPRLVAPDLLVFDLPPAAE